RLQGLRRGPFAVRQKNLLWRRRKSGQPAQQFALSRMSRELAQLDNFRANWHGLSKKIERLRALLQSPPARSFSLESRQDHGIPRIGQALHQVMQYAPPAYHSARADDDARSLYVVDGLGLFRCSRQVKLVHIERIAFAVAAFFARKFQVV